MNRGRRGGRRGGNGGGSGGGSEVSDWDDRRGPVEVEQNELGLFDAHARTNRTHEFVVMHADAPHHAASTATLQRQQVAYELARLQVPQLNRAVVRRRYDELVVERETRHGAHVLVATTQRVHALACLERPDFHLIKFISLILI